MAEALALNKSMVAGNNRRQARTPVSGEVVRELERMDARVKRAEQIEMLKDAMNRAHLRGRRTIEQKLALCGVRKHFQNQEFVDAISLALERNVGKEAYELAKGMGLGRQFDEAARNMCLGIPFAVELEKRARASKIGGL